MPNTENQLHHGPQRHPHTYVFQRFSRNFPLGHQFANARLREIYVVRVNPKSLSYLRMDVHNPEGLERLDLYARNSAKQITVRRDGCKSLDENSKNIITNARSAG